jgi:penicillin-binding protein 1A
MLPDPLNAFTAPDDPIAPAPRRRWRWKGDRRLWWLLLVPVVLFAWLTWALPLDRALRPLEEATLILLDAQGRPFARRGQYKDLPVEAATLPPHVVGAFVAIEDRRFFSHPGIDLRGIARAMRANAEAGGIREGGSTITQQLARGAFLSSERTFRRKLQEVLVALWLEARLDKHEILSRYLSSVYFGDGVYGLRGAARHYFDVAPEDLDVAQAAMLAGMVKAPSDLAPTENPEEAWKRAQTVIGAMVDTGVIDADEADAVDPPEIVPGRDALPVGGWFADWVSPEVKDAVATDYGEVGVPTTLDGDLQAAAERAIADVMRSEGRSRGVTQAALVAMRPSGVVVAMVGGVDYEASAFNRATQARRQPGSAFKLFVYRAALEAGMAPDTAVADAPIETGDWRPANYGDSYRGTLALRDAFALSSNVVAVRLGQELGADTIADAATDWGLTGIEAQPTIALGTQETSLLELTAAYAAVAAGVSPVRPHGMPRVDLGPGTPMDPVLRAQLLELLAHAVEHGTGERARLTVPTFGKTGTTQDYRDALFVGMAGDLVTGVWLGNDDNTPMRDVTGGTLPAEIWARFMSDALDTGRHQQYAPRVVEPRGERSWRAKWNKWRRGWRR